MAKKGSKGMPTISTGLFHDGYKSGQSEGPSPKERSMQTVSAKGGKKATALGRMLYQAKNKLTAMKMRKPF